MFSFNSSTTSFASLLQIYHPIAYNTVETPLVHQETIWPDVANALFAADMKLCDEPTFSALISSSLINSNRPDVMTLQTSTSSKRTYSDSHPQVVADDRASLAHALCAPRHPLPPPSRTSMTMAHIHPSPNRPQPEPRSCAPSTRPAPSRTVFAMVSVPR